MEYRLQEDGSQTLPCSAPPGPGCGEVVVSLGGRAGERWGECAGRYRVLEGAYSRGRKVTELNVYCGVLSRGCRCEVMKQYAITSFILCVEDKCNRNTNVHLKIGIELIKLS